MEKHPNQRPLITEEEKEKFKTMLKEQRAAAKAGVPQEKIDEYLAERRSHSSLSGFQPLT